MTENRRIKRINELRIAVARDKGERFKIDTELAQITWKECLTCKRSILHNGDCKTKAGCVPCLIYEQFKHDSKELNKVMY